MQGLNGTKDGWEAAACQNKKDYIQPNVGCSLDFLLFLILSLESPVTIAAEKGDSLLWM